MDSFQPNNTTIGENAGRVAVVTGPNCSGKSVYLQQVALIVYLAHIGCFVPAESARVGLTDRILTRIVADDSLAGSFASDLVQLSVLLKSATPRTLLLIDEFGKVCTCGLGRDSFAQTVLVVCPCDLLPSHHGQKSLSAPVHREHCQQTGQRCCWPRSRSSC